jgi:hypothetical protein
MSGDSDKDVPPGSKFAGLIAAAILWPVYSLFEHFGQEDKGFLVTSLMGVFGITIYLNGRAVWNIYCIVSLIALFGVQLAIILLFKIPVLHSYSLAILPFAILDFILIWAMLKGVGKIFRVPSERG